MPRRPCFASRTRTPLLGLSAAARCWLVLVVGLGALGIGAGPGCFAPRFESGKFLCAIGGECPRGFNCIAERCWREGDAPPPDGGGPIDPVDSGSDGDGNTPPVVLEEAAANPSLVLTTNTALSVKADDDGGEKNLIYTWTYVPPGPGLRVGILDNASNVGSNTLAFFPKPGHYALTVTVQDREGLTATSSVEVDVQQSINDMALWPSMASVLPGEKVQFMPDTFDQFGDVIAVPATLTWRVAGGCGTISPTGMFQAGASAGTCLIIASVPPDVMVSATVSVGTVMPVVLSPIIDAYVQDGAPGDNFGGANTLQVKTQPGSGNTRVSYLRFTLAGAPATMTSAKLRLFGRSDGATHQDGVYAVADNSWTETGITHRNKPALGAKIASTGVTTAPKYHEWDITAWVKERQMAGDQVINLAVQMDVVASQNPDTFHSKEGMNRPQLVLTP
jgi:hypothetical protein